MRKSHESSEKGADITEKKDKFTTQNGYKLFKYIIWESTLIFFKMFKELKTEL